MTTTTPSLWIAELDSLGYDFRAVGSTEDQARAALRKEWKRQVAALRRDGVGAVYTWDELADDVYVWEAVAGSARMGR